MLKELTGWAALLGAAAVALLILGQSAEAQGTCPGTIQVAVSQGITRCVLGLNMSKVIDLPAPARDILVSNPSIADAVMRTSQRIYLTGVAVGQTNIFIFGRDDQLLVNLQLEVERDITGLEEMLNRLIVGAAINVELINDNIVLSGSVQNAADARRANDIADIFANGGANSQTQADRQSGNTDGLTLVIDDGKDEEEPKSRIVNMLTILGEDQVHLRVTIAEIERNIVKQLGIDLGAQLAGGNFLAGLVGETSFPINSIIGTDGAIGAGFNDGANTIDATLRALESEGVIRTLAEPTLTAISGENASFLAGGEFPVPVGRNEDGLTIEYKPYGVGLSFTPVVLSEGRISLRIKTEVSEMSMTGGIRGGGGGDSNRTTVLPSIHVRRAETTVELPSGGSLVMAGLLQDNVRQAVSGFPGLMEIPVLGTLFRSRDFQRQETELVIIVTPYLVRPVARSALAQPDAGFAPATDQASIFLGRLNRMYGVAGQPLPPGAYHGIPGFIIE